MIANRERQTYSFSGLIIHQLGINGATRLRFIAGKCQNTSASTDAVLKFSAPFDKVCKKLPYLGDSQLRSLRDTLIRTGLLQRAERMALGFFSVTLARSLALNALEQPIRLDVDIAAKLGIRA